jgi:hypothetical protein
MRACAAFALQLSSAKGIRPEAVKASLMVCVDGVTKLVSLGQNEARRREEIAEGVRMAVGKAQKAPIERSASREDEERMAEPAVHGEIRHRVAVVDENIEIGQRAERGPEQRRLAPLRRRNAGRSDTGAQGDLGE